MIPSPNGRRVFHGRTGVREAVFCQTPPPLIFQPRGEEDRPLQFPTSDPPFDVSRRVASAITILSAKDETRVLTIAGLDEMTGVFQAGDIVRGGLSLENRYHFVRAARLLVTIPPANDRLVRRRVEFDPAAGR
jgi:hypothetical protein